MEPKEQKRHLLWITAGLIGMALSLMFIEISRASTIRLIPSTQYATKGQKYTVEAYIIPDWSNYTVVNKTVFKNAKLTSFYTSLNWMELQVPEYWNDGLGNVTRTAGFPGGFNTTTLFGTYEFEATEDGLIDISTATSSIILDADNKNVYVL